MNVGILKRYISLSEGFWRAISLEASRRVLVAPALTSSSSAMVTSRNSLSEDTALSKSDLELLYKSERKISSFLLDKFSRFSDSQMLSPDDLLIIGQVSLSRLQDPIVSSLSKSNLSFQNTVYRSYLLMYRQVSKGIYRTIYQVVSDEVVKLPKRSTSLTHPNATTHTHISRKPLTLNSASIFPRARSTGNLSRFLQASRQYKSGLGYPDLKRAADELHQPKHPVKAISKFNYAILDSLLSLPPDDPRQQAYRHLEQLIRQRNRILFSLESKRVQQTTQFISYQTFRVENLEHFISTLDSHSIRPFSAFTKHDFFLLKKNLSKFKIQPDTLLGSYTYEEACRLEIHNHEFEKLYAQIIQLIDKRSKILHKDKEALKHLVSTRLSKPKTLYLKSRLEASFSDRLAQRFLLNLEDEIRTIFSSYVDVQTLKSLNVSIKKRSLFMEDNYTSLFCTKLFSLQPYLTKQVQHEIIEQCLSIERQLRHGYIETFHKWCTLIPARLEFEMKFIQCFKSLRDDFLKGRRFMTSVELRRYRQYQNTLNDHLTRSSLMNISIDDKQYYELPAEMLRSILTIIKQRELELRSLWPISERDSITFHPSHHPHDPFNLHYIRFCKAIISALNIHQPIALEHPLDLIQGMFSVTNLECPNMEYAKKHQGFVYPNHMIKQSLVEFSHVNNADSLTGVEFIVPELMAIYLNQDTYYTVLGLLLVNDCRLYVESSNGKNYLTLDIPYPQKFRLLKTLDRNGEFRALTILEIGSFWMQEYRVKSSRGTSSFPLWVRGEDSVKFYHSFQYLLSQLVISSWKDLPTPDYFFVLKLIQLYLNTDPLIKSNSSVSWRNALETWADELIFLDPERKTKARAQSYIYALYGQVVHGEMYLFQILYRLLKEEHSTDELMAKLTFWYLTKTPKTTLVQSEERFERLQQIFFKIFQESNAKHQLYFQRSDTRCEKLAKKLEESGFVTNYKMFMIPGLRSTIEPIYRGRINEISFEHALLSDDGSSIYDLRIFEACFQRSSQFINFALDRPFTPKERQRILANPLYARYASDIETRDEAIARVRAQQNRLSSSMVRALWDLINDTHLLQQEIGFEVNRNRPVRREGILVTQEIYRENPNRYDELIQSMVMKRIDRFIFDFYMNLSDFEKDRLDHYLIYHPGSEKAITFFDLFRRFADPTCRAKHFCFDTVTEPLFEVVLSYDKVSRFREWLEIIELGGKSWLGDLRLRTTELEYFDNQSSPVLQKIKIMLFRLKTSGHFRFCDEIETRLSSTKLSEPVSGIKVLYDKLKNDVTTELTNVSKQLSELGFFSSSEQLRIKRDVLRDVKHSFTAVSASNDDKIPYYDGEFLVTVVTAYINTLDNHEVSPALRTVYGLLLKMGASRNKHFYSMLSDTSAQPDFLIDLIDKYRTRGIDITSKKPITNIQSEKVMINPTHMLEVNMNLQWRRYLQSLDESTRTRIENYIHRRSTHSNSFGL